MVRPRIQAAVICFPGILRASMCDVSGLVLNPNVSIVMQGATILCAALRFRLQTTLTLHMVCDAAIFSQASGCLHTCWKPCMNHTGFQSPQPRTGGKHMQAVIHILHAHTGNYNPLERVIKAASNDSNYSWCTCSEEICTEQLRGFVQWNMNGKGWKGMSLLSPVHAHQGVMSGARLLCLGALQCKFYRAQH